MDIEPTERCEATVRVFGEMGVDVLGSPISVGGPRQRRLLALLAIRAGSVASTDWLEESLWSDDERPDQTTTALRTSVSRLRTALPEVAQGWIETTQGGYTFAAPSTQPPGRSTDSAKSGPCRASGSHGTESFWRSAASTARSGSGTASPATPPLWLGEGAAIVEIPFQDDPNADSLWVASGIELVEIPLEPALWMERACEVVGREFTQDEWDLFVPGDEQVQFSCP